MKEPLKTKPSNIVKFVSNKDDVYQERLKKVEFALDKYPVVSVHGLRLDYFFIILRDRQTKIALEITPYTKLLRHYNARLDTRREETIKQKGNLLCMFLNYVFIENYHKFKIDNITEIKIEHGERFLKEYADGYRGKEMKSLDTILTIEQKLAQIYSDIKDVYKKEAKYIHKLKFKERTRYGGIHYISHFKLKVDNSNYNKRQIFRDLPTKVFWKLLKESEIHYPELTFAIALQAFAGLRPGEICNVRQSVSQFGPGIKYATVDGQFKYFQIDITTKYPMRKDFKDVGNIKVRRVQKVYEKYLPNLKKLYDKHLKILEKYDFKDGYHPMFINQKGQALTVSDYRVKIQRLISIHLKDSLAKSNDEFLRYYSTILMQYKLSPHVFRHWFTVALVIDGKTPNEVATMRGDSSINTSLWYCSKKTDIEEQIKNNNTKIMNEILSKAKEI